MQMKNLVLIIILVLILSGCGKNKYQNLMENSHEIKQIRESQPKITGRIAIPNTVANIDVFDPLKKKIIKLEYPKEVDPKQEKIDFKIHVTRGNGWIWNQGYRLDPNTNKWLPTTLIPMDPNAKTSGGWIENNAIFADEIETKTVALATGKEGADANTVLIFTCARVQIQRGLLKQWKCGCETPDETGKCGKWIKQDFTIYSKVPTTIAAQPSPVEATPETPETEASPAAETQATQPSGASPAAQPVSDT